LKNYFRYFLKNVRVISDIYMHKSTREPIIKYLSLKECILRIKLDSVINIYSTKHACYKIMPHDLITNSIGCSTYLGC
jgi:hypothetical protein